VEEYNQNIEIVDKILQQYLWLETTNSESICYTAKMDRCQHCINAGAS
jgi:hypothetical protein